MRRASWLLGALAVATSGACTRDNPEYCDMDRPCAVGVCNLNTHYCEEPSDAPPGPPDAPDPCRIAGGQIVLSTDRAGTTEIARLLADGSGFQLLTTNAWPDTVPRWSPDGSRIAWISRPGTQDELYVMNRDGSDPHDVSVGNAIEHRWSPDGTHLLFTSNRDGNGEIYVVAADGTGLTNLTMNPADDRPADWSSDGSQIVFTSTRDGSQVYVMNADGSSPMPLTDRTDFNYGPRWSPSGSKIAWVATTNFMHTLWMINPDGSAEDLVDPSGNVDNGLEWSPDGSRLVYSAVDDTGTFRDIFTVTAAGTSLTNVTNEMGSTNNELPTWSPDGSRLLFRTDRDGNREIYAMTADGTGVVNLTNDASTDEPGGWSACP